MTVPSKKSPGLESMLETLGGRTTAIESDTCVLVPIGCGQPATKFRNDISYKEYTISGLCQNCQDDFFGTGGE